MGILSKISWFFKRVWYGPERHIRNMSKADMQEAYLDWMDTKVGKDSLVSKEVRRHAASVTNSRNSKGIIANLSEYNGSVDAAYDPNHFDLRLKETGDFMEKVFAPSKNPTPRMFLYNGKWYNHPDYPENVVDDNLLKEMGLR